MFLAYFWNLLSFGLVDKIKLMKVKYRALQGCKVYIYMYYVYLFIFKILICASV